MRDSETIDRNIERRTALKALGAGVAGLTAVSGRVAAVRQSEKSGNDPRAAFPLELLNPRTRNAAHAWKRGYIGRADRSLAITDTGADGRHGDIGPWNGVRTTNDGGEGSLRLAEDHDEFDSVEDVELPSEDDLPQLVAWHDDELEQPRDTSGHGTGVASIMAGSGRAWSLNPENFLETFEFDDEARELTADETVEREFEVPSDLDALFVGVAGNWLDVTLLGPDGDEFASAFVAPPELRAGAGSTVGFATDGSAGSWDGERETLSADTVHDDGERTYTIRLEPVVSGDTATAPEVRRVAVTEVVKLGTELPEEGTVRSTRNPTVPVGGELSASSGRTVYPGEAPGYSLVVVPDASLEEIAASAETYARKFGVRAVNQSWGTPIGEPTAAVQNPVDDTYKRVAELARAGIMSTHAVANQPGQPTGGNDSGSGAPETISCVNTNSLSGIMSLSSGGLATVTEDGDYFRTPDVCAVGTNEVAAATPADTEDGEYGEESGYDGGTGTSYAAPSVAGLCGLVMDAMERDGPEGLDLPSPEGMYEDDRDEEDRLAWTLKTKSAVLATASTTAFNAIPWHGDQTPAYTPGERDPYEGFGRINYGAAVDAVSRDLTHPQTESRQLLGLGVPDDAQAAAGYITGAGEYTVSVAFDGYEGEDANLTNGAPHVDLFVYDALSPEGVDDDNPETGTPTVVARHLGVQGDGGSVTVSLDEGDVYFVVVKLVSVPGDGTERLPAPLTDELPDRASGFVFNGADVRAALTLDVAKGD